MVIMAVGDDWMFVKSNLPKVAKRWRTVRKMSDDKNTQT